MTADAAINPTMEGDHGNTNKYLNELERTEDTIMTSVSGIKNIQQEMDANLMSRGKTTPLRILIVDMMQTEAFAVKGKGANALDNTVFDEVLNDLLSRDPSSSLARGVGVFRAGDMTDDEAYLLHEKQGKETALLTLVKISMTWNGRRLKRYHPPKPPWPSFHGAALIEPLKMHVTQKIFRAEDNVLIQQTSTSNNATWKLMTMGGIGGKEECTVHLCLSSRRDWQQWIRYKTSRKQMIAEQTIREETTGVDRRATNGKGYATTELERGINEQSPPLHQTVDKLFRPSPQLGYTSSVQGSCQHNFLSRNGCQCWPKITRATTSSTSTVSECLNVNIDMKKTAWAPTAHASNPLAPPSDFEEVVGPLL